MQDRFYFCKTESLKSKIANHVILAHRNALKSSPALYEVSRTVIKTFTIPGTILPVVKYNVFKGQVPNQLIDIVFMNKSSATNGSLTRNPLNMELFNISSIGVYVDGEQATGKPLMPNLTGNNKKYLESYQSLFYGTVRYFSDTGNEIRGRQTPSIPVIQKFTF